MALDKIMLRNVVKQAIQQLPTIVTIKRKHMDSRGQADGTYDVITTLTGLIYQEGTHNNFYTLGQNNLTKLKNPTYFLVDWNESSILVKDLDLLITTTNEINKVYEIQDTGSNFEIYHNMLIVESALDISKI